MNIKIKNIESKLNKTLKKNTIVIAFDSSAHSTGIALIKTTNESLIIEKLLNLEIKKNINEIDALDLFTEQLDEFKRKILGKYKFDATVIEDVYIGINPKTGLYLARISALVYDRFKNLSKKTLFRYPITARTIINFKKSNKNVKGEELKKELINYINQLLKIKITNTDLADALILALSELIIEKGDKK